MQLIKLNSANIVTSFESTVHSQCTSIIPLATFYLYPALPPGIAAPANTVFAARMIVALWPMFYLVRKQNGIIFNEMSQRLTYTSRQGQGDFGQNKIKPRIIFLADCKRVLNSFKRTEVPWWKLCHKYVLTAPRNWGILRLSKCSWKVAYLFDTMMDCSHVWICALQGLTSFRAIPLKSEYNHDL